MQKSAATAPHQSTGRERQKRIEGDPAASSNVGDWVE